MSSASDGCSETELHAAAWSGDVNYLKEILAKGIDVNVTDSINETPLHGACGWGRIDVVDYLLGQGANPNCFSADGLTPLHWACSHGTVEILALLIKHGALLQASKAGLSPMEIAKKHNNQRVVAWLKK
ncbi:ankyrin repeat domain-containing protein [Halioxenophilus sp. WMMB6]|uniref:ankyrin repeat domain-containing protein n=1 Tax=Halioxenophilus sp. WMMB6 TaxID=3073815 RepID=UPI00295E5CE6|nr:ankyrin repeat domain-containing protein [Halioxenophilus sp. WMMB6]